LGNAADDRKPAAVSLADRHHEHSQPCSVVEFDSLHFPGSGGVGPRASARWDLVQLLVLAALCRSESRHDSFQVVIRRSAKVITGFTQIRMHPSPLSIGFVTVADLPEGCGRIE